MSALFLNGNTNQHTFANAALAAHVIDVREGGPGLSDVFVLHSPQSEEVLLTKSEWKPFLREHGLEPELFVQFTVDLVKGKEAIARVARHLKRCVASVDRREDVYVDLTNGASLYKSVLSNVAYVLGVRRAFFLDPARVYESIEDSGSSRPGFLSEDQLAAAYVEFPDPSLLDAVAPEWLVEVRRFNLKARSVSSLLCTIAGATTSEQTGFESDIANAVHTWFRGAKANDGAALGGAVRHVGRAFEDLVRGVFKAMLGSELDSSPSLHDMLLQISSQLQETAGEYEPHLLSDVAQLLRRLRNASTHEQTSPEFGRIRARLSTELLFATAEYFRILDSRGLLQATDIDYTAQKRTCAMEGVPGKRYFFGVDGDDTGHALEQLFHRSADGEEFARYSERISSAIEAVAAQAKRSPLGAMIRFCAGDDLLFEGEYNGSALRSLQDLYLKHTGGQSCSIGFGATPKEAYVALKMAKASIGKGRILGVEVVGRSEVGRPTGRTDS